MTPILQMEYSELSDSARRLLPEDAPFPTKVVAAKALLPLMSSDLVAVLYYLSYDSDDRISKTASENLDSLPENILAPVMRSSDTSPKVLAYLGLKNADNIEFAELIALNQSTPDEVISQMTQECNDEGLIELYAGNQNRFLRYPKLIHALVNNPVTPQSTIDRIIQFYRLQTGHDYTEDIASAVETETTAPETEPEDAAEILSEEELSGPVETDSLPEDEIYEDADIDELIEEDLPDNISIEDVLKMDFNVNELFAQDFLVDPEAELSSEKRESLENRIRKMNVVQKMQVALRGNIEARNILMKSPNKMIQECVIKNQKITIDEINRIAQNKSMNMEIIRQVSTNREWIRNYHVRLNMIYNPKTPLTTAIKWLSTINIKDLEKLSKSKQIPGMLAVTARKALENKQRYN